MDHEESERCPFEPILPAGSTPPDERRDQFQQRPEAEPLSTGDVVRPFVHFDQPGGGPHEPGSMARSRADRSEDRPATFGDAGEPPRSESEPIADRPAPDLDALTAALASLAKQISRAGREQFKANTLAEAQRDQLNEVLEALRAAESAREEEVGALRERANTVASQARREVARAILPAVDGLDAALYSGKHLLAAPAPRRSWWRRHPPAEAAEDVLRGDLRAWLIGLEFVRERLLSVLAAEEITPIAALGLPFDPQVHLAAEVSRPGPDSPPGTVTAVIRQGYLSGGRVLRPAEVAVARAD